MASVTPSTDTVTSQLRLKKGKKKEEAAKKATEERDARINYTLDMVVHDLVNQGHLHPAKSYLLKTPEMREHIGKMCDKLNQRKKNDEVNRRKSVLRSRSSLAKNVDSTDSTQPTITPKQSSTIPSKSVTERTTEDKPEVSLNPKEIEDQTLHELPAKLQPWVTPRDIVEEHAKRTSLYNGNHHSASLNTFGAPKARKELHMPDTHSIYSTSRGPASAQAYRAKVDMSGFKNDEISLDLDDRRLIITAQRQKKGLQNARKVTEVIDIPGGVNLEHLKIGRRLDGTLLIEEFVPEVSQA